MSAMNTQGRATRPMAANDETETAPETFTGNRALHLEEKPIFEKGAEGRTGVDLPEPPAVADRLGGLARSAPVGLPGLSEPQVVRHYTRLSQKNYAIDAGLFPLGSCTMKHNPRLNERLARLPGFADLHPMQPESTIQGALQLMQELSHWILTLTGMPAVALSPGAGAHGELTGMAAIRAALEHRGEADKRRKVLVPDSAHGTNPATAASLGFQIESIEEDDRGRVDFKAFERHLGDDVAAIMLTNPNTCGVFEYDIRRIADALHEAGGYFYCDGANFNAIVGRVRPGDLGVDAMHLNLHKTFSTPHGGGGPGSGPVVYSEALAPFAPVPRLHRNADGTLSLIERAEGEAAQAFGRVKGFHGQMGMFVRALTYMLSHGSDGLRQVAEDAVLNANYLKARLKSEFSLPYGDTGPCMHEVLFDDHFLKGTGVSTLDFAKAMIDEGFHPMTMYFPLVVHGAMLIEPTETETKNALDEFADALLGLARAAKAGDTERFAQAPRFAPRKRLDETQAARKPVLRWQAD
ncbi:MAG: aminomethyl-transferring glycine dehydrogenase subunit GcvPB [Alphaproteobacteria bacterium]|nr:aminomethyl-transferring glycine dehydrogenase subunit GcvPB [Alphaproteobacteria bacterium]